jgi:hypothetical protein
MPPVQLLHGSRTSSADATNAGGRRLAPSGPPTKGGEEVDRRLLL